MRSLSGASLACAAVLALGSLTSTVGCAKVGEIKAKKAFKSANQAYQQQDYRKAADLYEDTVAADPNLNSAYFFLGNSYDNQYKPSKKGDAANDALLTKAVDNYDASGLGVTGGPVTLPQGVTVLLPNYQPGGDVTRALNPVDATNHH